MTRPLCTCCISNRTLHHCTSCKRSINILTPICPPCSYKNGSEDYSNIICNRCALKNIATSTATSTSASHPPEACLDTITEASNSFETGIVDTSLEARDTPNEASIPQDVIDTPNPASNPLQTFTEIDSQRNNIPESSTTTVVLPPQN